MKIIVFFATLLSWDFFFSSPNFPYSVFPGFTLFLISPFKIFFYPPSSKFKVIWHWSQNIIVPNISLCSCHLLPGHSSLLFLFIFFFFYLALLLWLILVIFIFIHMKGLSPNQTSEFLNFLDPTAFFQLIPAINSQRSPMILLVILHTIQYLKFSDYSITTSATPQTLWNHQTFNSMSF